MRKIYYYLVILSFAFCASISMAVSSATVALHSQSEALGKISTDLSNEQLCTNNYPIISPDPDTNFTDRNTCKTQQATCTRKIKEAQATINGNILKIEGQESAATGKSTDIAASIGGSARDTMEGVKNLGNSTAGAKSVISGYYNGLSTSASGIAKDMAELDKFPQCKAAAKIAYSAAGSASAAAAGSTMDGMQALQMATMGTGLLNNLKSLMGTKTAGGGNSGISGATDTSSPTMSLANNTAGSKLGIGDATPGADLGATAASSAGTTGGAYAASGSDPFKGKLIDYKADPKSNSGISDKSALGGGEGTGASTSASLGNAGDIKPEGKILDKGVGSELSTLDFGSGGGGGRPSMLGLKGASKDLEGLIGAPDNAPKGLGLGAGAEERQLASADGNDVNTDVEVSLFAVIHDKMKDMKKRGYL